jgi:hypothetical protein
MAKEQDMQDKKGYVRFPRSAGLFPYFRAALRGIERILFYPAYPVPWLPSLPLFFPRRLSHAEDQHGQ